MSNLVFWLTVGFLGQALFTARFLVQWIASERKRRSVVPVAFWWLSLLGRYGASFVCDFPAGSGYHHRPSDGSLCLRAQPDAFDREWTSSVSARGRNCRSRRCVNRVFSSSVPGVGSTASPMSADRMSDSPTSIAEISAASSR